MSEYVGFTAENFAQIQEVLQSVMPDGTHAKFDPDAVIQRNGDYILMVQTDRYPEQRYQFTRALAEAENDLRDAGLPVRLEVDIPQREIVVAWGQSIGAIAYRSTDGTEFADLANILRVPEENITNVMYTGFAYDSKSDFNEALHDAQKRFPKADFSRVGTPAQ
ncbi:MAG: hypothetical protein NT023_01085 [Armatimonadetes bacterium]|nr:hypothetical protein [Armatimonadota bacterium]